MQGKSGSQQQKNMFVPLLSEFINPSHPLVLLSARIPWSELEQGFAQYYSHTGKPSKPVRLMIGLLLLKQMYDLGDETVMAQWVQNPYFQYFCGMAEFQWRQPCDPSDLVHFRHRIGKEGAERILGLSVSLQQQDTRSSDVLIDTTVQEKNISYPTDSKLYCKIIEQCRKIACKQGVRLRRSYRRKVKELRISLRFSHHPRRKQQARKALKRLKTIAGCISRDLMRKLPEAVLEQYHQKLVLFERVLKQKRQDKNKIYSLHEPDVSCIAKGKAHKAYEFGSKVSIAVIPKKNIIVGVVNHQGNPHDGKTLESALQQVERITGRCYRNAIVDRGYRGIKQIASTTVICAGAKRPASRSQRERLRRKCRSRAAIEPIIGHLKHDYRMLRNYLKGTLGDEFNALMAAAAFNFRRLMRKLGQNDGAFVALLVTFLQVHRHTLRPNKL